MNIKETKQIQAVAIFLMMWHHLFGCGKFLILDTNLWGGENVKSIISYFGASAKICVGIFLVCSGYGLYKSYINRSITSSKCHITRITQFLLNYWVVLFFVAIPYLAICGKFEVKYIFVNLFALLHNDQILYVSFSWYVKLYLLILLFVPIMKLLEKSPSIKTVVLESILYIILPWAFYGIFREYNYEENYNGFLNFVLSSLRLLAAYLPIFYSGIFLAKYKIIEKVKKRLEFMNNWIKIIGSLAGMVIILFLRGQFDNLGVELIYSTAFIICCYILFDNIKNVYFHRLLQFLGKYSFWYWMLSGMFFLNTSELQWILFIPYHWLVIIIWTFIILTPIVIILDKLTILISTFAGHAFERITKR